MTWLGSGSKAGSHCEGREAGVSAHAVDIKRMPCFRSLCKPASEVGSGAPATCCVLWPGFPWASPCGPRSVLRGAGRDTGAVRWEHDSTHTHNVRTTPTARLVEDP